MTERLTDETLGEREPIVVVGNLLDRALGAMNHAVKMTAEKGPAEAIEYIAEYLGNTDGADEDVNDVVPPDWLTRWRVEPSRNQPASAREAAMAWWSEHGWKPADPNDGWLNGLKDDEVDSLATAFAQYAAQAQGVRELVAKWRERGNAMEYSPDDPTTSAYKAMLLDCADELEAALGEESQ